jgi:hypothetical protein
MRILPYKLLNHSNRQESWDCAQHEKEGVATDAGLREGGVAEWGGSKEAKPAGSTSRASPAATNPPDGGACFIGRPASAPQLQRNRDPLSPLSAGKRAEPTVADGVQPLEKATAHSPPSTETCRAPASRSSATPIVLPASNQPLASSPTGKPLPLGEGHQRRQECRCDCFNRRRQQEAAVRAMGMPREEQRSIAYLRQSVDWELEITTNWLFVPLARSFY